MGREHVRVTTKFQRTWRYAPQDDQPTDMEARAVYLNPPRSIAMEESVGKSDRWVGRGKGPASRNGYTSEIHRLGSGGNKEAREKEDRPSTIRRSEGSK